ncbi:MAG: adenine deaminase [Granulosicoccus sp.]
MSTEPQDLNDTQFRSRAISAAQGNQPFDVLIRGGRVADVITGQLRPADVGLVGPLIASVHKPDETKNLTALKTVDAENAIVCPGLIDMHMHVESSMITPQEYSRSVLPRGVTTAVWDPHELANVAGLDGIDYALKAAQAAKMRFLTLAPSCVPSAPGFETTGGDFDAKTIQQLLAKPDIHGVAEVMSMQAVLGRSERMTGIVQAGLASGKRVCGHARGLDGLSLNAYVSAGIQTDHELTSAEDLLLKLQAGLTIELRGSHDHLLPEFVVALNSLNTFPQTVTLCTDDVFPNDLYNKGGVDDVVRRLIRYGLDPMKALQAATLNASTQLGRRDLGVIAPGRRADIAIVDSLDTFNTHQVFMDGDTVEISTEQYTTGNNIPANPDLKNTTEIKSFNESDFEIYASGTTAKVATIKRPRFTQWGNRCVQVDQGKVICPDDMTQMAVINRFSKAQQPRLALLEDWGEWRGVFATTVSHDSHNVTLFGKGSADFALAANTVRALKGGLAVVSNGEIMATMGLPLCGLMQENPLSEVAYEFDNIVQAMENIVTWQPPYLVFKACFGASLVCNAGPHLSDLGIVDSFSGDILDSPIL